MTYQYNDTIVALASGVSEAAIAIIRLSGPQALYIIDRMIVRSVEQIENNTATFVKIYDNASLQTELIDEGIVTIFRAPRSYTGEDTVEINCHGSPYIMQRLLHIIIDKGARMAERGEFTLRAFLNGKMDLSQAEAVADLIASDSAAAHELAIKQMRGGFADSIKELRQELIDFAALIELELDFSEEDVTFADRDKLLDLIQQIQIIIGELLQSFRLGNVLKNGVATVIAGRPNAGKSTLLNALLNEERAIVSDIAGTTRDTIEETLNIRGIKCRFVDTAGIRHTEDTIEKIGVEKALNEIKNSTLTLYVVDIDSTSPEEVWQDLANYHVNTDQLIVILNKMDLNPYTRPEMYIKADLLASEQIITASAIHKMNIEALKDLIYDIMVDKKITNETSIVSNVRHLEALEKTHMSLEKAIEGIESLVSSDFIAMDIRQALRYLGEISGEIHTDDLLDSIFTRFCIGK